MEKELLIRADGVTKMFGQLTAVDNVSMDIYSGEIYGVAGLNGAGKSTLLAILAGVMRPDAGAVLYGGAHASAAALRIGYVPQEIALFPDLSVYDNLKFWSLASGSGATAHNGSAPIKERIAAAAEIAGLSERMRQTVRSLSGGMRQRVNIAAALVAAPDILIMDEPTAGLDVKNRRDILNFVNALARGGPREGLAGNIAVVCTSHQSGELEMVSDRLLLLDRGRAVFDGPPSNVFSGKYAAYENIDDILYSLGSSEFRGQGAK
ncbi:MAG: ABC transporter ATP-binding protein [Oscillospiraceae bacterium]|nr:ABC transporter ATP-binding protein [Oscillospiraceae bacterium]